jgi:hypothetical protein
MKTSVEITQEFKTKLDALLKEYGAEMEASDHFSGYAECGEDVRITVSIPSKWDDNHEQIQEYTEIDLGRYLRP